MTDDLRDKIAGALRNIGDKDFPAAAEEVFSALGYRSDLKLELSGNVDDFISAFPSSNPNTQTEQAFHEAAESAHIVFQVTDAEIEAVIQPNFLNEEVSFDKGNNQSFIFVAVELAGVSYPRGKYAEFVREVNKRINSPTVVLFRTAGGLLTLAFVNRRLHKRDESRDVLGKVSLIREIYPANPHRAHLDILSEISLNERLRWMDAHGRPRNFDGLLDAWLDALDTEELNKRFYRELFGWFERAVNTASFPKKGNKALKSEEHVIRLITRLLFIWFIKEKGLVAEDLFIENRVRALLKDYDRGSGDSYYRAVLQNLFFATLNTEIGRRGFSSQSQSTHRDFSRYRYKREIADPDNLLDLFKQTPFINGGLFDCLDSEAATGGGGWRIDCFTDNPAHRRDYSIPNRLFFGEDGLIDLFDRYKFTVEENTPAEQEVALDPELLGKVFENLLAAYNPETRETARKQTGSYYTPRAVVDYMVDEALVASLSESVQPDDGDREFLRERLRYLLDYADAFSDADTLFTNSEREAVVRAIAEIKILDPAVGSGAFPMSMLHKLTLALRRLDERNELWEDLQKETASQRAAAAFDTSDQRERDDELKEISDTFEKYRDSDFGRKLYLIQNSIFGVDIQPVATQIAKLRFFISLAIEQQPDFRADNLGIRPLPNLETRFVAANTLLGLGEATQIPLGQANNLTELHQNIRDNRERHFHATNRSDKLDCRRRDSALRKQLSAELENVGMSTADANKIAQWDPYDQNASADWFDPEYMFGVSDGFDVVIGNPPYVQLQKDGGRLGNLYEGSGYETFIRSGDIYQLFYERGCQALKSSAGLLAYITSNSWLKAEYGKRLRRYFSQKHTPLILLELGKDVFESAIVDSSVLLVREGRNEGASPTLAAVDIDRLDTEDLPPNKSLWGQVRPDGEMPWSILSHTEQSVMDKMQSKGTPLKEWGVSINFGIKTGHNKAFIINDAAKMKLIASDPKSAEIIKPILRGRDIQRYKARYAGIHLIDTHNGYNDIPAIDVDDYPAVKTYLDGFYPQLESRRDQGITPYNLRSCAYYENFSKEKLLWLELVERGRFAYDDSGVYGEATTFMLAGEDVKFLCAMLNSSLIHCFLRQIAPTSGMGTLRWKKAYVERLPIPKISATEQRPFIHLVDRILQAKAADPQADTSELEEEIDWLVYDLYDLTDEETAVIADAFWDGELSEEEEDAALVRAIEAGLSEEGFVSKEEIMAILRAPSAS